MKKTERLNGIIFMLKERGKITAKELSEIFEVSERTIYRDIDALSQLKVPIIAYDGFNGGYKIDPNYFLPSIKLTEREIIMLLIILRVGEKLRLPNLSSDYQLLMSKIINTFSDSEYIRVEKLLDKMKFYLDRIEPAEYTMDIFSTILEGLMCDAKIGISYYVPERDQLTDRHISPTLLFFDEGAWYITGLCHMRDQKRTFRLDRIKDVYLLDDKTTLTHDELMSISDSEREDYVLDLTPAFYRVIKDNFYMQNSEILSRSNDAIRIRVSTSYWDDITNIVLSNPHRVTIISPDSFKEELKQKIKDLSTKYL